jgi:hypothetical protein
VARIVREQLKRFSATLRNREVPRNKRSRKGVGSVPYPQRDRIKRKFISGENISKIAREEGRHWDTVARIVKEKDVAEYVRDVRERFYGALEEMLSAAIDYAKTGKDGGWLAYEMLKDGGVIPDEKMLQQMLAAPQPAPGEKGDSAAKRIAVALVEDAIQRHPFFGLPLPEADEAEEEVRETKGYISIPNLLSNYTPINSIEMDRGFRIRMKIVSRKRYAFRRPDGCVSAGIANSFPSRAPAPPQLVPRVSQNTLQTTLNGSKRRFFCEHGSRLTTGARTGTNKHISYQGKQWD